MPSLQLQPGDHHPFVGTDVWRLLSTRARTHAGRPFLVWQPFDGEPTTTTFDELAGRAAAVASGLAARGVKAGDRVLIHLENSPEFVVSWFACTTLGAVAVTTNTRSALDELAYYAADCGAVGAITQPRFATLVAEAAPGLRFVVSTDHDSGVPADTDAERFDVLLGDPSALVERPADPLAPCSVQYTSGTTSRPKGVLWTHANALWGARYNAQNESLRPDDCHLIYLPLFHTNALAYSMLSSLWVGARFVLTPKWSTSRFWDISLRHGCTWLSLMGLSIRALSDFAEVPAGHSYRLFGTGMCDLPIDERYGVKTIGWWGMTETISTPIVGDPYVPSRPMAMGRPNPHYGIRVVREDGSPVSFDEPGELLVRGIRGLSLFAEYLNKPDVTADSFDADGWFKTGDIVVPHACGHLTFENRAKDMLKVGAENVSAAEVERVISAVPGVVESAIVGRPDPALDEVPVAFVTTASDDPAVLAAVEAACAAQLADFKRPRAVYRVEAFPRSTLNKINKVELRAVVEPDADRDGAVKRWVDEFTADPSGDAL
jgi:crotonobetaine/carnitine-CoA ligase